MATSTFKMMDAMSRVASAQPQRSYLWRVVLPDISGAFDTEPASLNKPDYEVPHHSDIDTRIYAATFPFPNITADRAKLGNRYWHWADKSDIGNLQLSVYEYEDEATFRYFDAWSRLIMAPGNTNFPPAVYKRDIEVYRLNTVKLDIMKYVYKGFFFTGFGDQSNDYDTSGITSYEITLAGDSVVRESINWDTLPNVEKQLLAQKLLLQREFTGIGKDDIFSMVQNSISGFF